MSFTRIGLAVAVFATLSALGGCDCKPKIKTVDPCSGVEDVQPDHFETCSDTSECADHFTCGNVKDKSFQCCVFADRKCNTEADCCPGQTCPSDRKKCFDKVLACDTDSDCGDKGDLFCEPWTDH